MERDVMFLLYLRGFENYIRSVPRNLCLQQPGATSLLLGAHVRRASPTCPTCGYQRRGRRPNPRPVYLVVHLDVLQSVGLVPLCVHYHRLVEDESKRHVSTPFLRIKLQCLCRLHLGYRLQVRGSWKIRFQWLS